MPGFFRGRNLERLPPPRREFGDKLAKVFP